MISTQTLERLASAVQQLHQVKVDLAPNDADLLSRVELARSELLAVRAEAGRRAFGKTFVP